MAVTIQNAVKKAMQANKCIMRKIPFWTENESKIKPTNTAHYCICMQKGSPAKRGWEPLAEDLIANDWIVVD